MKKILPIAALACSISLFNQSIHAQGCVAIRSTGGMCMMDHSAQIEGSDKDWQLTTSARYFKSFRHFSGTEENKARLVQGTEVINHQSAVDFALYHKLNKSWSVMIDVPVNANSRSSLYEHGLVNGSYIKKERHSMHSFGIGDARFAVYKWLLDPAVHKKANIQLGVGMKLPTGDYRYVDYWYNVGVNGTKELRPVDQSIQLGDGGTGITAEMNAFYNLATNFGVYGNFYYLSNPRDQNGVRTYRETLSSTLANEDIMSVPDQYMARAGVNYATPFVKGLSFGAGVRLEGIPVYDLIGASNGFRRPGYIWSIEPGVAYHNQKGSFFITVPVAFIRNRTQSVTDKENSIKTGKFVRGDAAFADYTINVGYAVKL